MLKQIKSRRKALKMAFERGGWPLGVTVLVASSISIAICGFTAVAVGVFLLLMFPAMCFWGWIVGPQPHRPSGSDDPTGMD